MKKQFEIATIILLFSIISITSIVTVVGLEETSTETLPNDQLKKLKFDQNFETKIQNKIQVGDIDTHEVILFVKKITNDEFGLKNVSDKNKDQLVEDLLKNHNVKNFYRAEKLSFVTAHVPVANIPSLANYDYIEKIGDGEIPLVPTSANMDDVRTLINAENLPFDGSGVIVAVIDTGMNSTHPDLDDKIIKEAICDDNACVAGPAPDLINHGTHIAGIIAGSGDVDPSMKGIASGATLLNAQASISSGFLRALDWALVNDAKIVSSGSISGFGVCDAIADGSTALGINEAVDEGLVFTTGMGNQASGITFPSCVHNAIAVGAIEDDFTIASFSHIGPATDGRLKPELVAPGVGINSTDRDVLYAPKTGTSFSQAIVAGSAALILDAQSDFSPLEVKSALILGADWKGPTNFTASDYEDGGSVEQSLNEFGFGVLNVTQSLTYANSGKNILSNAILENEKLKYSFTAPANEEIKVILSWLKHPSETILNATNNQVSNLDFEVTDSSGSLVTFSDSINQNNEFVVFTPTTSDDYTITVKNAWIEPFNYQEYTIASTHELSRNPSANVYSALNVLQDGVTIDTTCSVQWAPTSFVTVPIIISDSLDCGGNPNKTDIVKIQSTSTSEIDLIMFYANNGGFPELTKVEGKDSGNDINFKSKRVAGTLTLRLYETDTNGNIISEEANMSVPITKNKQITITDISELKTFIAEGNTFGIKLSFTADSATTSDLTVSWGLYGEGNGKEILFHVDLERSPLPGATGFVLFETKISETQGNFTGSIDGFSDFGESLSDIGDLDGDGILDLAVGMQKDSDGGVLRGALWILFLNTDGTVKSHQKISDTQGNFTGILNDIDQFGASLANIGDLDGDGVIDLAVGAQWDDDGSQDSGAVWILFLNTDGTVKSHQKISSTQGNFTGTLISGDQFGSSTTSIGDLDGDGVIDLAVGASWDDDGVSSNGGAVWILFLNTDGTVKSQQKISSTQGNFNQSLGGHDHFGTSTTSIGDLDGDSIEDIAVGSLQGSGGGLNNVGAIWTLFLNTDGTVKSHQKISLTEGNFTGILDDLDQFGASLTNFGDIDGDGVIDLAVGAQHDDDGGPDRGAVWILFLNTDGTVKSHQKISNIEGNFNGTLDDSDFFGGDVTSIGDLNGDGFKDLVVGAAGDDDDANPGPGSTGDGAVWVLFLN